MKMMRDTSEKLRSSPFHCPEQGYPRAVPTEGDGSDTETNSRMSYFGWAYVNPIDDIIESIQENLESLNCAVDYFKKFYTVDWNQGLERYRARKSEGGTKDEYSGEHTEG